MNDVETEQQRNAEAISLDRQPLEAVDLGRVGDEQQRTRTAVLQRRLDHPCCMLRSSPRAGSVSAPSGRRK